jgi:hypothetical protein
VQWLAYPYGAENSGVVAVAQAAGYVLAVTTHGGTVQRGDQPLLLSREEILDSTSLQSFAALLGG